MNLCMATNNHGKIKEISSLLPGNVILLSLKEIGCHEALPENQDTLEGNSREKAAYIWNNYGINCLSDDSGLEVGGLGGAPGVYSAMYAGPDCNPVKNMELLLSNLNTVTDRKAMFRTVITLVVDGIYHQFEGLIKGAIADSPKGTHGFGYDPVFIPEGYDQTFAEIGLKEKNSISHRALAVAKLVEHLSKNVNR